MNKQQAQEIIKDTFESSFDKNNFAGFIKNLLNRIDDAPFIYQGNYIPDAYKQYIKSLERIGKFSDGENNIDILVITLQKETSLERARTMKRNFVAWYLNGSRGGEMKDAALAAFISPDEEDWRFSLVKMDYKFDKTQTGKIKVKEEFTPARRWSFLVGANEKSHTAQSRLVNILANDEQAPILKEIENAFDIETVTKEFFLKYRDLFLSTKEELDRVVKKDPKIKIDFESKGVDTVNFAKKLLGQIIFLYFLQKKGWFGTGRDSAWGDGSRHFLRELFKKTHGGYYNFFNDILEPLFYEALRIDRSHDDDYYSRFNCKIPFLNGGLFDPIGNYDWVHTDIYLPDKLFSNQNKTTEGDIGDGILDIFDRYNFTVKEDEPLEKEVAIDPELLGKAYEKFNAIRPDNYEEFKTALKSGKTGEESKFNKKFGVYYTPREIVHYMCQQSLINYLAMELEVKLLKGTIEFLILDGEKYIEHLKTAKEKNEKNEEYRGDYNEKEYFIKLKMHSNEIDNSLSKIKVCDPAVGSGAFPVGMMTEIIKARMFFVETGCVEQIYINSRQEEVRRTPYNFKRDCIENSLYGVDIDPGAVEIAKLRLWLSLVVDEDDIQNIKPLPNLDYKIVCGNSLIGFPEIWGSPIEKEIESLIHQHFNETNVTKKNELKANIDKKIESRYKNSLKTFGYQVNFDFRTVFSEVFQKRGGFDVIIANPPYVEISGITRELRNIYIQLFKTAKGRFDLYLLFIEKAMQLKNKVGGFSFIIPGKFLNNKQFAATRKLISKGHDINVVKIDNKVFEAQVDSVIIQNHLAENPNKPIYKSFIISGQEITLLSTIDSSQILQNDESIFILEANENIDVLIEKIKKESVKLREIGEVKDGIIAGRIKDLLFLTNKKDNDCKKLYFGKQINRFHLDETDIWVNYKPENMMAEEMKRVGESGPGLRMRNKTIFERGKIIYRKVGKELIATYDEKGIYYEQTIHSCHITDKRIKTKFVLGLFNSKLLKFYYHKTNSQGGNIFPQVRISSVENLPIKLADNKTQEKIENLVDQILEKKKEDATTNTSDLENKIDKIVYELYNLTAEEIEIVESKN